MKQPDPAERPREKLLRYGAGRLTPPELLAIFLDIGGKGRNSVSLAIELLNRFGSIRGILEASTQDLLAIKGLGEAKVAQIKAVYALAEQHLRERVPLRMAVRRSQELFDYLSRIMRGQDEEVFKLVTLNGQNEILDIADLVKGPLTPSTIYPREVIKLALKHHAAAVIFAHNHLSGDPRPSPQDRKITEELLFACRYVGIRVLDHIVLGEDRYYSFADEGLIEQYDKKFEALRP